MNNDNQPIAPTPEPAPQPTAPQTDPVAFPADSIVIGDKKSKKPLLIAAIIAGVVLIAGIVFGIFWLINYNKPETVAMNAMSKFLGEKAVKATGDINIELNAENDLGITSVKIRLDEASSAFLPSAATGTIIFGTGEDEISMDISTAIISDGTMYFQLAGVTEVLQNSLPAELIEILDIFESELSEFDGQWYELDIVEMAALFGQDLDMDDYDCVASAISTLNSGKARDSFVMAYQENPFIILEKTDKEKNDGIGYTANSEEKSLDAFLDHLANKTPTLDAFKECDSDGDEKVAEFENSILPDLTLYITNWGHELKAIDLSYEDDSVLISGSLNLTFPESLNIKAPEDAKPFSGFLNDFITKLTELENDDTQDTDDTDDTDDTQNTDNVDE